MTDAKRAEGKTYTFSSGVDQERAVLMAEEIAKGKVEEFAERVVKMIEDWPKGIVRRDREMIAAIRELVKEGLK